MNVIKINIDGKQARNPDKLQKIVCGNTDYVIAFTFSEEWAAHEVKTARFVTGPTFAEVVFTGNECPAPKLSNVSGVEIGVYAGDLETTTRAYVDCEKSILCGAGVHAEPPADVYNQLAEMCDEAVQTANAVEERANNGEFKGDKGDKGDKGEDGHTPEKGVDYFTEEDKAEIVQTATTYKVVCAGELDETTGGVLAIKAEITEDISKMREFHFYIEFPATEENAGKTAYVNANISGAPAGSNSFFSVTSTAALKANTGYSCMAISEVLDKCDGQYVLSFQRSCDNSANNGINARGNALVTTARWNLPKNTTLYLNINNNVAFLSGTKWRLEGR